MSEPSIEQIRAAMMSMVPAVENTAAQFTGSYVVSFISIKGLDAVVIVPKPQK